MPADITSATDITAEAPAVEVSDTEVQDSGALDEGVSDSQMSEGEISTETSGEEASATDAVAGLADLDIPEGMTISDEQFDELTSVLADVGIPQTKENIDTLLAYEAIRQERSMAAMQAQQEATLTEWEDAVRNDKDLGGDKFDENIIAAQAALKALGTPELTELFRQSGLGSHPEVVRLFVRLAPLVREERPGVSGQRETTREMSRVERLYGASGN